MGRTTQQGLTIVPLKVYFNKRGLVKVEIALAKGRHTYDKRRKLKEKTEKREAQREMKNW
jgi:SsrA-binding protein